MVVAVAVLVPVQMSLTRQRRAETNSRLNGSPGSRGAVTTNHFSLSLSHPAVRVLNSFLNMTCSGSVMASQA